MKLLTEEQYEQARDLFEGGISSFDVWNLMCDCHLSEIRRALGTASYADYYCVPYFIDDYNGQIKKQSKLSADDVRFIFRLRGTMSQRRIAFKFGVDPAHISAIYRGKAWRYLHPDYATYERENRPAD